MLKIIEFEVENSHFTKAFLNVGYSYLGLVSNKDALEVIRQNDPPIADYFYLATSATKVSANNATVILIKPKSLMDLIKAIRAPQSHQVWWPYPLKMSIGYIVLLWYKYIHIRIKKIGKIKFTLDNGEIAIFQTIERAKILNKPKTRRYISPRQGLKSFFLELNSKKVRYVVLRWFETLPDMMPPGEDIDLLVSDDDLEKITEILSRDTGILPCDLYSVSGHKGSDYLGIAYYPPYLAETILEKRVLHNDFVYVPSPEHHLFSMMYHIAYHKAERSGLPINAGQESKDTAEHPYDKIIHDLAAKIDKKFEITLKGIHDILSAEGWSPPGDVLRKLSQRSEWIRSLVAPHTNKKHKGELMVFIARQSAAEKEKVDYIISRIKQAGLVVLNKKTLNANEQQYASRRLRGGNWHAGPWAVGGGLPHTVIVAYDPKPIPVPRKKRKNYPNVTNARFLIKHEIRDELNKNLAENQKTNFIHSSDNDDEAWEYLAITCPESEKQIKDTIAGGLMCKNMISKLTVVV